MHISLLNAIYFGNLEKIGFCQIAESLSKIFQRILLSFLISRLHTKKNYMANIRRKKNV